MSDETITDFIRASREICDKATPGPVDVHRYDNEGGGISYQMQAHSGVVIAQTNDDIDNPRAKHDAEFVAHARTALPRALDIIEAQQKQLADLRDELADEQAVSTDWQRYYMALSDLAHGDKPACLAPEVCGEEHGPCKSCAVYKKLAEQQAEIERLRTIITNLDCHSEVCGLEDSLQCSACGAREALGEEKQR